MSAVLISSKDFHAMLGISQASFFRLRAMGKIGPRPIKLGKSVRWDEAEVKEWIAAKSPNARQWQSR